MVVAICVLCLFAAACLAAICSRYLSNRRIAQVQTLCKQPSLSAREQMWFLLDGELFRLEEHLHSLRQLKTKFELALQDFRQAQTKISQTQNTWECGAAFFASQDLLTQACATTYLELPAACVDACVVELVKAYKKANRFRPKSLECRQKLKALDSALVEINSLIAAVKSLNDTATPLRELLPSSNLTPGSCSH